MSSDLHDSNLSTKEQLLKEYVERGFVELQKGTEVRLKLRVGQRIDFADSIVLYDYDTPLTLEQNYLAKPIVLTYSIDGERIAALRGFYLTTEELLRLEFQKEQLVPNMGFDNSRFGEREKFTKQQANEMEQLELELTRDFLDSHGVPREIGGNEILGLNIYID